MLSFENDYAEGAHEKILARLIETNREQLPGYGTDHYCAEAKEKIRNACECPDADVFFLVGGTQTNATVIDGMLAPYEGVIAASTGHVSLHEAGAIEYTGHKVITLPQHDGKIYAAELEACLRGFWEDESHEHMVFPGMVYLSHPTEYGTLYTAAELEDLSAICHTHQIPLYSSRPSSSTARCLPRGGFWASSLTRCSRTASIFRSAATPSRWRNR